MYPVQQKSSPQSVRWRLPAALLLLLCLGAFAVAAFWSAPQVSAADFSQAGAPLTLANVPGWTSRLLPTGAWPVVPSTKAAR